MKMTKLLSIITFLIFSCMLFSCKTSIDSIIDEYNSNFTIDYANSITSDMLSPGDVGFNPAEMLKDEYYLGSDTTLNISAPYKSASFSWFVSNPLDDEIIPIKYFGNEYEQYVVTEKVFSIDARTCGLEVGKTYKLTLQVTDQGGLLYTDVCAIVVYQRYNFLF